MMSRLPRLTDLRGSLLAVSLAVVIAATSVVLGQRQLEHARRQLQSAHQQLSAAHHALATARNDALVLPAYAALYRSLQQRHVLGEIAPNFGFVIEQQRPFVINMHYNLSAPYPYSAQASTPFELTLLPVNLQLELLHEGRLLDLLDGLRAHGWFMLERCSIEPADDALHADCSGGWLTVKSHANH